MGKKADLVMQIQEAVESLSEEEIQCIVEYAKEHDISYWEAFESILNIGALELAEIDGELPIDD